MNAKKAVRATRDRVRPFQVADVPLHERPGWNKAFEMFLLEFFSSTEYLKQMSVYDMAKRVGSTYGMKGQGLPSKEQIAAVCSCR
jgi:hypothetical protein